MARWGGTSTDFRAPLLALQDTTAEVFAAYLPFFALAIPTTYLLWRWRWPGRGICLTLWVASLAILVVNLSTYPGSNAQRYVISQLPLAAVVVGAVVGLALRRAVPSGRVLLAGYAASVAVVASASPFMWTHGENYFDPYLRRPPMEKLAEVAALLKEHAVPGASVITLETPLVTEAGLRAVPGLEAGDWSIVRRWDREQATRVGVTTFEMLLDLVRERKGDLLAEGDGSLSRFAPDEDGRKAMAQAIAQNYREVGSVKDVSNWGEVRVYVRQDR